MRRLLVILLLAQAAAAKVEFEAYYAVDIRGKPVGLGVQRNEVDEKTGERTISYLLKTTPADNDMEQFVRIKQDKAFRPLSLEVDSKVRDQRLKTEGAVKNGALELKFPGTKADPRTEEFTPDTFFAAALGPVLMARHPTKGQAYAFEGYAEEEGRTFDGEILIVDETTSGKLKVFRTILRYLNLEQEVWLLEDGTSVATQSTTLPVKTYLIKSPADQMRATETPRALIAKYFRVPPVGDLNALGRGELTLPKAGLFPKPADLAPFKNVKRIPLTISK